MKKNLFLLALIPVIFSCSEDKKVQTEKSEPTVLFSLVPSDKSQVTFANNLNETYEFNFLNYAYIYIGGGVSVGDVNNDDLPDIYFSSNQESNKLYLNKGDFVFEDITASAGVSDLDGWSAGTSMIDINNDGYLDIYVCKAGALKDNDLRRNKLYINQKDNTFKESAAEYGLDHPGFSTQSYFFDYDKDGDLDMYLVNHRPDFQNNTKIDSQIQNAIYETSSDQLFRNDGNTFTKVSSEAGVLNKAWGLSAAIGDFNNDNWPDIYVANDYLEPDILYINNQDGTFKNEVLDRMKHISFNSMGSDYADINNDLLPDLMVLDMLAEDHKRGKENMASMSTENFRTMVNVGYHHQYMANVLQLNNGDGSYSDIGQLAGITKTDWSWAPLIADFDNDGHKDVFISNGIEKDMGNQDFRRNLRSLNQQNKTMKLEDVLNMIPSERLPNYAFKNNGDLTFSKKIEEWGLGLKVNSNGAAYADLDNDGDLDLILNNQNSIASIFQNNAANNYINIALSGNGKNKLGIGAKVTIKTKTGSQYQEMYMIRGFQSSVSNILTFGLGDDDIVESIEVKWPDNKVSKLTNVKANQMLEISQAEAGNTSDSNASNAMLLTEVFPEQLNLDFKHEENNFEDFTKQLLLPQKQSTQGPCLSVADVNGDGFDDVFVGGAHQQAAMLYLQNQDGTFIKKSNTAFNADKDYEDNGSLFFDADGDGDQDLYVTSGGYEFNEDDVLLQDRLYTNDGRGNFTKSSALPQMLTCTKSVKPLDYDKDGDLDLVIGGRLIPGKYPLAPRSYLLENDNGTFTDVTETIAPDLTTIGMVNAMEITDYNNDNNLDIILVGPWMPVTILSYKDGQFLKEDIPEFEKTEGWYYALTVADMDKDGDMDFVVGNLGWNNKFQPKLEKPLHIFSNYFDDNDSYDMALSKYYQGQLVPVRGKECSSEQTPFLNDKIGTYKEFASLNMEGIYGNEAIASSHHLKVYSFSSVYIENLGNGDFKITPLPAIAQRSPTMDFEITDINEDGYPDIVGVGNLYDAEVETIRYDASRGYILLGNGSGGFDVPDQSGLNCDKDMRAITSISIAGTDHFVIASNNDVLSIYKRSGSK